MRKQTKIAALVSAAALLTIGAAMTSFAAAGWSMEDGQWVYLDRYGDRVTQEWRNSNGNQYWLDDDGYMAVSQIIEDDDAIYYVDASGVRVRNQWISVDNEDDIDVDGKEVDTLWYYFGNTGKAYKAKDTDTDNLTTKTVAYSGGNAKFVFDTDGCMVSGWTEIGDDTYYLGDENEGWAHTDWQYLEPADFMTAEDYDDEEWFNFKSSGKLRKADAGLTTSAYIDGSYYSFNEDGVLEDDWFTAVSTDPTATYSNTYANVNGSKNGWIYTTKPAPNDDESAWYYLITVNGTRSVPFNYNGTGYDARVIGGKTYLFEAGGAMKTGLVDDIETNISVENGNKLLRAGKVYYFSEAAASQGKDGRMMTGKVTVEKDGDTFYYYFDKSTGAALENEIKDNVYYGPDGKRVQAEDGNSNALITLPEATSYTKSNSRVTIPANAQIIVNSSGRVRSSGSVKIDGYKYHVTNYVVDDVEAVD